ncbi:hypothetical protein [Bradyrhizobium sp. STM 3557]|uniref:hypothetical protein n=1 Tax=Bradyrhizobium sp. STM 3557 TaxID=578920 RepID=UPI00388FA992
MADTGGFQTFWLWGAGIIILGLILAFAATRAGRLGAGERARLDRNTEAAMRAHDDAEQNAPAGGDLPMRASRPYAILIPIVVVVFAVALMIWSLADTHGPSGPSRQATGGQQSTGSQTTGSASRNNQPSSAAPPAPANDAGSDSARGNAPLNRSR